MRILLNAEPFGFGPSAAIAAVMPYLRPHCQTLGYVGSGHTLDLQTSLPYDAIHDLHNVPWENYDVFLTALDFGMARQALQHGLKVAIYDPLTWYWPTLDPVIRDCLYIPQAFYGVQERLEAEAAHVGRVVVVPPLVAPRPYTDAPRAGVLVNLGGLQNPLWPLERVQTYASTMARAIRAIVPAEEPITLTTSVSVAVFLKLRVGGVEVVSLPHHEIQDVMAGYKVAFMTPGLGNMYDASGHGLPTIWLPPANDSQGRQLDLLCQHSHADDWVDWADLGFPVVYDAPQPHVMARLAQAIETLEAPATVLNLQTALQGAWARVETLPRPRIGGLIDTFGHGGAAHVARAIFDTFGKETPR